MAETLHTKRRNTQGTRDARRLRQSGSIPAVVYGHGEETVPIAVSTDELAAVVRHGSRLVELEGDVTHKAFIKELQWDSFGSELLHVDFARVSADERIRTELTIELRGEAPGTRQGGVVKQALQHVEIECPVDSVPHNLQVNINNLELDGSITVADIELPPGAIILVEPTRTVVTCIEVVEIEEDAALEVGSVEPELIGKKDEAEEGATDEGK